MKELARNIVITLNKCTTEKAILFVYISKAHFNRYDKFRNTPGKENNI